MLPKAPSKRRLRMSRFLTVVGLIGLLALSACGPAGSGAAVLPTFIAPGATAEINSSYPTQQAQQQNSAETVGGFVVNLQRAWRDGKQVNADVCYTLPDASDWTIWNARFEYSGQTISEFSSSMLSRQEQNG